MTEEHIPDPQAPPAVSRREHPIGKSLFGGAILATIATVSLTQTYLPTVNALNSATINPGTYVALGGYSITGDGGGGVLLPQPTSVAACAPDNGLVFGDGAPTQHCLVRANPTNSVREWGAQCDVTAVTDATWTTTSVAASGTLTIPDLSLSRPPTVGDHIVISQVGVPMLWGTSTPAVSMTRFSTLSNVGTHYMPGDVISFSGGTFSQQVAIVVDAVDGGGAITQWHFLWGGSYQNDASLPSGAMSQDDSRSHCGTVAGCGTGSLQAGGAMMSPMWSGWSLLNKQNLLSGGSGYAPGDIVTFSHPSLVANQGHFPRLIVEATDTTAGTVTAYDWIDYGSLAPSSPTPSTLTATGGGGLSFGPVAWSQAPFASIITSVSAGPPYTVLVQDSPTFLNSGAVTMPIQYLYYGIDDSGQLANAIKTAPKGGLVIPAGCGTTQTLNLSPPSAATSFNPANVFLTGSNFQTSGLYAFAAPPSQRNPAMMGTPVLAHILQAGLLNTSGTGFLAIPGGGFSNMFIEGLGLPQGYGYYGLVQHYGTPTGYVGPTFGTIPGNIPTAGNLVEFDAGSGMRIDKVLMEDGGIGPGNAVLQCGLDESNPPNTLGTISGAVATLTFTDSRLDVGWNLIGAANPDFVLRLDAGCHDSAYDSDTVYDGTKADILVYNSNLFGRMHLSSDAANSGVTLATIAWTSSATFNLAGLADYGFYVIDNSSISETQCDIANRACIFTVPGASSGGSSAGQITDTQMKCASFVNTPPGYTGVELSAGATNTTVTGTAPSTQCVIYPFQLVRVDGTGDPTISLCNNSNAALAGCTGYQGGFATGQAYTQPAVTYATGTVTAADLFAVPFFSPAAGGTISKLGLDVVGTPPSGPCLLGIYNAAAQSPTTLVQIGSVTAVGTLSLGPGSVTTMLPNPGAQLAPATLYFLAVTCNATVALEGVTISGGLSIPLIGATQRTDTNSSIKATTGYPSTTGTLSASFPLPVIRSSGTLDAWVPNVYAKP